MAILDYIKKIVNRDSEAPQHFVNTGTTGTEIYSGSYNEEYLYNLKNMPNAIDIYDKMRRSDSQIQMLLGVVKKPIIASQWGIEAVDDSEEEQEIKEFVEHCLFNDICSPDRSKYKTFRQFISEALTAIDFGYSAFELTYKVVMDHPTWGNYIGIRDIGFRSQKTIYEWNLHKNGAIKNIRQLSNGDLSIDTYIDGRDLLVITFNKEGDNYEGISHLRPIYGNWLRKDFYYKIQAMGIERSATGVLVGSMPAALANNTDQVNKLKQILKLYTSHEKNYIIKPENFQIDFDQLNFDADKVQRVIDSEDQKMAKSFLAGFLELGMSGGSGSQALSKDLSSIFLDGIKIYSETIADAVEHKIIKTLVDAKFGVREKYPQLRATDVNSKASKERAEIAVMLKNAGLIKNSDQLEDSLNREFDFPIISAEQKAERVEEIVGSLDDSEPVTFSDVKKLADDNPSKFIKERSKSLQLLMNEQLTLRTEKFLDRLSKDFRKESNPAKRRKILQESQIPDRRDYKQKIRLDLAMVGNDATRRVLKELGRDSLKLDEFNEILKDVPKELREKLKIQIDEIITDQDTELKKRMFFVASQKLDTTDSVDLLIASMREAKDKYLTSGIVSTTALNAISGTVNSARNAVFQTPQVFEEIESFIIVNPSPEAAICKNLVGRVFSKDEYLNADLPPYHHNCETTVKAQLKGVKGNKPVNPVGLKPTGSEEEITAILKSKTF